MSARWNSSFTLTAIELFGSIVTVAPERAEPLTVMLDVPVIAFCPKVVARTV